VTVGTRGGFSISSICHSNVPVLEQAPIYSCAMNDQSWIDDIQWQDVLGPIGETQDEEIYTLTTRDFLQMPDVNFSELVHIDPQIRALLN
jgi:hypothetical protein